MGEYRDYRGRGGYRRGDGRGGGYYDPPRRGGSSGYGYEYRDGRSSRDPYYGKQGRSGYYDSGYRSDSRRRYEYQDSRYRSGGRYDEYSYDDGYGYYDYGYERGGMRFGVIILLSVVLLVAVAGGLSAYFISRTLKAIDYQTLEAVPDDAYDISASDLMRFLPDDELTGEELNDYHLQIYRTEILKSYYSDDELVSKASATNILITAGEDEDSLADIIVIMSIDSDRRQLTFTSLMPETGIAYLGMDNPVRLACAPEIGGPSLTLYTVQSLLGIKIDKYIMLDYDGLAAMIDTMGGVEVELTAKQSERLNYMVGQNEEVGINAAAGGSVFTGQQLIMLARYAAAVNPQEASGLRRQLLYSTVCGLKEANYIQAYNALSQAAPHMHTNITGAQVFSLAAIYRELRRYNVMIDAVPADGEYKWVTIEDKALMRIISMKQCRSRFLTNALGIRTAEVSRSDAVASVSGSDGSYVYDSDVDEDFDEDVDT